MTTGLAIFLAAALKGGLLVLLKKKGWWPDWEQHAREREEDERVLRAYKEWRKGSGSGPAADPRVSDSSLADSDGSIRTIQKRTD